MNVLHICMFASQKIIRLSSCMCVFCFFSGTSSIDTTCTIWGLETGQVLGRVNLVSGHVKTQLIAHDKEVSKNFFSLCTLLLYWNKSSIFYWL